MASLSHLNDPKIVGINKLPTRSYFLPEERLSLNGTWAYKYTESPQLDPIDGSEFQPEGSLQVPGHWQLQGVGKPMYTNVQYPFNVNVPFAPSRNPTVTYSRTVDVPEDWADGGRVVRLRFEGVDCAAHVFLNGHFVGYSEGSRNPAEFDVSKAVRAGSNRLVVRVYQWSSSTYIEDQDQWWLSGIFRDVYLLAFNKDGFINDFSVSTKFDSKYVDGVCSVHVDVTGGAKVAAKLVDGEKVVADATKKVDGSVDFAFDVKAPHHWSAEIPYLYLLELELFGADGSKIDSVHHSVGFRQIEMKNNLITANGKPLLINGTNHHEHHPRHGRAVPYDFMIRDLHLMKQHNINAIRMSHYPADPRLYGEADRLGFWIFDEADLECHGLFEAVRRPIDGSDDVEYRGGKLELFEEAKKFTSDNPDWERAYVDRATAMVLRDRNHACVIVWSLGNEAFFGRNHHAMAREIRRLDPANRPVHYEPDFQAEVADMYSRMYPLLETMKKILADTSKPLILCEYGHAMGNGPGLLKQYQEIFREYKNAQGGFIWEWNNHGIESDRAGQKFYGYGGDFGEKVHDGVFCMDGLVDSEHNPTPGLIEYKKVIEPIGVVFGDKIEIENRFQFIDLSAYKCSYTVKRYTEFSAEEVSTGEIELPEIAPESKVTVPLPEFEKNGNWVLTVEFRTKFATAAVEKNHLVAWAQLESDAQETHQSTQDSADFGAKFDAAVASYDETSAGDVVLSLDGSEVVFSNGAIKTYTAHTGPVITNHHNNLTFYRPETNNDASVDGPYWRKFGLHQMEFDVRNTTLVKKEDSYVYTVTSFVGPPVSSWRFNCVQVYTFDGEKVSVKTKLSPKGFQKSSIPKYLPRLGYEFGISNVSKVSWLGRGPGESYLDKKELQRVDLHTSSFGSLDYSYEYPQENGNHEETQWVLLEGESKTSFKMTTGSQTQRFGFKCSSEYDVEQAKHPHDIKHGNKYIRVDYRQQGVGSEACGPGVLDEFRFNTPDFLEFEVIIKPE